MKLEYDFEWNAAKSHPPAEFNPLPQRDSIDWKNVHSFPFKVEYWKFEIRTWSWMESSVIGVWLEILLCTFLTM